MRRAAHFAVALLLAACGGEWEPGALGTLAYVSHESGALVVQDVSSRDVRVIDQGAHFGGVSLSPDARRLAYSRELDTQQATRVHVAHIADGTTTAIRPDYGALAPVFHWGRGGWMLYRTGSGDSSRPIMVLPNQDTGHSISNGQVYLFAESPTGERIAYADCVAKVGPECDFDIVEHAVDGTDRRVLATGAKGHVYAYTSDGTALIGTDRVGAERRILVRPLDGGPPVDLGPAGDLDLNRLVWLVGASRVSPDGTEVLIVRDSVVEAVRIDGTGRRLVVDQSASNVTFTPSGAVLYEVSRNLDDPSNDIPNFVYSTYAISASGEAITLRFEDPQCRAHLVSPDGDLVAFQCAGTPIHRISDGSFVIDSPGDDPVAFTSDGIIAANLRERAIWLVPFDGTATRLATYADTSFPRPYDYQP